VQLFILFLTALFIAMVTVPLLMRLAERFRFVDLPDPRKVHTSAIPRVGGIGMVIGTVLTVALWLKIDPTLGTVLVGIGALSLFGIADDRHDLDYRWKFLGQFIAVLIVVVFGGLLIRELGPVGLLPGWIAYPLTILFLVGTTNAMNLSDGLDGLAAGLSVLSLAAIAYLAELAGGEAVIGIAIATIGAIFGFLRYNTHPAVVFMGDTGSQFLGFSAGVLAVMVTQDVNTAISAALPLLIMGLPVVDTLLVMGERIAAGTSPFRPDRRHFHHKLLALGFDHYESVLAIYSIQALFILLACFLRYESDLLILGVYLGLVAAIGLFYPVAQALRWRLRALSQKERSLVARSLDAIARRRWAERAGLVLTVALVAALLLGGGLVSAPVARESAVLAAAILAVWVLSLAVRLPSLAGVDRPALYAAVLLVIYLIGMNKAVQPELQQYADVLVVALAVVVGFGVRFSRSFFLLTPSDFLVLFILVAASTLPVFSAVNYARLAVEAAVVLYGVEFALRRPGWSARLLRGAGMLALAGAAARGFGAF
jgi:UDP-GlcNAc:undecaprenyl-phosphate GlcNAc-1-phosphate transferase